MNNCQPIDFSSLSTYSLHDRSSKVTVNDFVKPLFSGMTVRQLMASLPNQLMCKDFPELVSRLADSHRNGRPVIVGMG
ncbi:MAG: hypothetical protein Q8J76_04275, partial [Desulfobulbaceae bacterium]|nr:hypothetical protein [Desulfobulbaceae bacterium]